MIRTWADKTRVTKYPIRGTRILAKNGFVKQYDGKKWINYRDGRKLNQVAVLSTGKLYHYDSKWRIIY